MCDSVPCVPDSHGRAERERARRTRPLLGGLEGANVVVDETVGLELLEREVLCALDLAEAVLAMSATLHGMATQL